RRPGRGGDGGGERGGAAGGGGGGRGAAAAVRRRRGRPVRDRGAAGGPPRAGSAGAERRGPTHRDAVALPPRRVRARRGEDPRVHRGGGPVPARIVAPSGRDGLPRPTAPL